MKSNIAKSVLPTDLDVYGENGWHNWNFDKVPTEELSACCWWEYLRESGSVRDALLMLDGGQPKYTDKNDISALFSSGLWGAHVISMYPNPWQLLSPRERKNLAHNRRSDPPSPFEVSEDPLMLSRLTDKAQIVQNERGTLWDQFTVITPAERRALSMALARSLLNRASLLSDSGIEYVLVKINWRRSKDDIISAFEKWVVTSRPHGISPRQGRPPQSFDPEAALDGLALMRLLRHYKPSELETNRSRFKVWSRCKGRQFHARGEAKKRFKTLFGFRELPLSWGPTKGGRSR